MLGPARIKTFLLMIAALLCAKGVADNKQTCRDLVSTVGRHYKELHVTVQKVALPARNPTLGMTYTSLADCENDPDRVLKIFQAGLGQHPSKVGVLLSFQGRNARKNRSLIAGLERGIVESGLLFNQAVVIKDTQNSYRLQQKALFDLIFVDQVQVIIVAGGVNDVVSLFPWADKLEVPFIFMTADDSFIGKSQYSFRVFPDERAMGIRLATKVAARGYRKIGMLRPEDGKADRLLAALAHQFNAQATVIVHDIPYESGNHRSMESAVQRMFKISTEERADEYRELLEKGKERAKKSVVRFNPRQVFLPPEVDIDALIIPDDFRVVRHFVKLLEYNQVKHMPLIGDFGWRSPGLVEPPEAYLRNAFFVDFIGAYDRLPASLRPQSDATPVFAKSDDVQQIDTQMVGYRTGLLVAGVLHAPGFERLKIPQVFLTERLEASGFFPAGRSTVITIVVGPRFSLR
jgi:hypothetical protein